MDVHFRTGIPNKISELLAQEAPTSLVLSAKTDETLIARVQAAVEEMADVAAHTASKIDNATRSLGPKEAEQRLTKGRIVLVLARSVRAIPVSMSMYDAICIAAVALRSVECYRDRTLPLAALAKLYEQLEDLR